jgi:hypothetical protein
VRIATWNLAGRWSDAHAELINSLNADVLLLTEVDDRLALPDCSIHRTSGEMAPKRTWAAVATRAPLASHRDPHPATAMVTSGGWTFASSILPWRTCGTEPWGEGRHANKTVRTVDTLVEALPREGLIWGGDWNHALTGREYAGSIGGRAAIVSALETLGLAGATEALPHRIGGLLSIDHIAIPTGAEASVSRVNAFGLSDHDAYVAEVLLLVR